MNEISEIESSQPSADKRSVKEQVRDLVCEWGNVTFAQLVNVIPNSRGDSAGDDNLILWVQVSAELSRGVLELLREGKVVLKPTHILTYVSDQAILNYPIPERGQEEFSEPHWIPTVLCKP